MLVAAGYGLAAFTKPVFPLAPSIAWLVAARFVDRIGKGIRGAPRDALVADLSPAVCAAPVLGLRQSLDTVGAFIGPPAGHRPDVVDGGQLQAVFWVAVIPAFLSLALIVFAVREPDRPQARRAVRIPISLAEIDLGPAFWWVVAVASVFTLARFSEAFLCCAPRMSGCRSRWFPPCWWRWMSSTPSPLSCRRLSDRIGRTAVLAGGILMLIAADSCWPCCRDRRRCAGVVLWGLHMGLTQGLLAALVADTAPAELRGTAFGLFNLLGGLAMLAASVIAGALWDLTGPQEHSWLAPALHWSRWRGC